MSLRVCAEQVADVVVRVDVPQASKTTDAFGLAALTASAMPFTGLT
jgi:hypothetical protein